MKSYKLYLFDFDDTLLGTIEHAHDVLYPKLATTLGLKYKGKEHLIKYWRKEIEISFKNIFDGDVDIKRAVDILTDLHEQYPAPSQPGVKRIFNILKKHQKFIGLFSTGLPQIFETYHNAVEPFNNHPFDFIFHTAKKTTARVVSAVMEKYAKTRHENISLEDIVLIGDSIDDFKSAGNAGIDFTAVLTGIHSEKDFINAGCSKDRIYPDIQKAVTPSEDHGVIAIIKNNKNEYLFIKEARINNLHYGHWSGPHGRTIPEDVIEEETVCRETLEECGLRVIPVKKLYTRSADSKVKTVTFWQTSLLVKKVKLDFTNCEVSKIAWFSKEHIKKANIKLYPGTKDFLFKHQ